MEGIGIPAHNHQDRNVAYLVVENEPPGLDAAVQRLEPGARRIPD